MTLIALADQFELVFDSEAATSESFSFVAYLQRLDVMFEG
jgi:hypothetical protein